MPNILKQRREEIGKQIEEIAVITRIKKSYLKAIEDEDFEKLPIEVYTKGYIREYAEFLDITVNKAFEPYERYIETKRGPKGKEHSLSSVEKISSEDDTPKNETPAELKESVIASSPLLLQDQEERERKRKTAGVLCVVLSIVIAGSIVIYFMKSQGGGPAPLSPPPPRVEAVAPIPEPFPSLQGAPQFSVVGEAPPEAARQAPAQTPGQPKDQTTGRNTGEKPKSADVVKALVVEVPLKKHTIDITASEKTWLQVVLDGSEKKDITLQPGDRVSFGANETVSLLVGNAAGVKLKYDGRQLDNLGGAGEVVRLSFPESTVPQPVPLRKKEPESVKSDQPGQP